MNGFAETFYEIRKSLVNHLDTRNSLRSQIRAFLQSIPPWERIVQVGYQINDHDSFEGRAHALKSTWRIWRLMQRVMDQSLILLAGLPAILSSGKPVLLVPGTLLDRMSLSSWVTLL